MRNGKAPSGKAVILAMVMAAVAVVSPRPAPAAEPAHFAVMGVRLYMSAQEVLAALYAQGVREDGVHEHIHPCALHAAAACTDSITARLPDGPITVRFADAPPGFNEGREAAFSVVYRLTRGPPTCATWPRSGSARFRTRPTALGARRRRWRAWQPGLAPAPRTARACPIGTAPTAASWR